MKPLDEYEKRLHEQFSAAFGEAAPGGFLQLLDDVTQDAKAREEREVQRLLNRELPA